MRTRTSLIVAAALVAGVVVGNQTIPAQSQGQPLSTAAVPGEKGGQDIFGAYNVAAWPKPLTALPNHSQWTWGAGQGVFAESPNRVFVLQRG